LHIPPPGRGGNKIKGFGNGEENQRVEKPKTKNIEDITLLAVLKCNIKSPQHYSILFRPK